MNNKRPKICIAGSINMDLTVETPALPEKGETLMGSTFATYPGGKGANQAVAASRLGSDVSMIGAVGSDPFGKTLIQNLQQENIHTTGIAEIPEIATGIANIIISDFDNRIIVIPGANNHVTPDMIEAKKELLLSSDMVLLQFEIPMESIEYTVKLAYDNHIPVIVNPAPFQNISEDLLKKATYITPNEIEATALNRYEWTSRYLQKLIVTMGAEGVEYYNSNASLVTIPAFDIQPVDTTGAGDTFNGALAVALSEGQSLNDALAFANKASALSVLSIGAQNGMPMRQAVETSALTHR